MQTAVSVPSPGNNIKEVQLFWKLFTEGASYFQIFNPNARPIMCNQLNPFIFSFMQFVGRHMQLDEMFELK